MPITTTEKSDISLNDAPHALLPAEARARYERDGFCLLPQLVPDELIARAIPRMDAVMEGEYLTGVAPIRGWNPGDDPTKIRKIDQAQLSDPTLFELVTHPAIGQWAAQITGAQMIQVWVVQMLYKPPGRSTAGGVGWHQDWQYWGKYWQSGSEVFTAWLALSEVREESGPMRFVAGSHQWGFLAQGNFFDSDVRREDISIPAGEEWREVPALLPPGGVSLHHRYTYHGSGPNVSDTPRRAFAIHLRTEKSAPLPGSSAPGLLTPFVAHLDDPQICPVIYGK